MSVTIYKPNEGADKFCYDPYNIVLWRLAEAFGHGPNNGYSMQVDEEELISSAEEYIWRYKELES